MRCSRTRLLYLHIAFQSRVTRSKWRVIVLMVASGGVSQLFRLALFIIGVLTIGRRLCAGTCAQRQAPSKWVTSSYLWLFGHIYVLGVIDSQTSRCSGFYSQRSAACLTHVHRKSGKDDPHGIYERTRHFAVCCESSCYATLPLHPGIADLRANMA